MTNRQEELVQGTERARQRLQHVANQYGAMAEPLVVIQWLIFRSLVQEAHLYAVLEELATGQMNETSMQRRWIAHAERIANDLYEATGSSKLVAPLGKRGRS